MSKRGFFNRANVAADSEWERELTTVLGTKGYHQYKIPYTIEKEYNPDWTFRGTDTLIHIEAKGRFMDKNEAAKYTWVAKHLPPNHKLIFLFMYEDTKMPHAKKRKDGTTYKQTEWAEKNNFTYFAMRRLKNKELDMQTIQKLFKYLRTFGVEI